MVVKVTEGNRKLFQAYLSSLMSWQGFYYENDVGASLTRALSFSLIPARFASGIRALIISAAIHAPVIAASTRNALNRYLFSRRHKKDPPCSPIFNYNDRISKLVCSNLLFFLVDFSRCLFHFLRKDFRIVYRS